MADRLSLKNDLEIARDIQLAMLPPGTYRAPAASRSSARRGRPTPSAATSTTCSRCADGRLVVALGDVAGKGSPAALLMALLLAMLRTLVDEGLEPARARSSG